MIHIEPDYRKKQPFYRTMEGYDESLEAFVREPLCTTEFGHSSVEVQK